QRLERFQSMIEAYRMTAGAGDDDQNQQQAHDQDHDNNDHDILAQEEDAVQSFINFAEYKQEMSWFGRQLSALLTRAGLFVPPLLASQEQVNVEDYEASRGGEEHGMQV